LALACGYVFDAMMTVAHALSFPDVFAAGGLLGGNSQTTAWVYMFWHGGFPLFVIAYVLLRDREVAYAGRESGATAAIAIAAVAGAVIALTSLATAGVAVLPEIMNGNGYTAALKSVIAAVWALSLLAALMLWRRPSPSLLDLWLTVVMCAWLFDIALSAVLNAGRYDLGFYAGRAYGLVAAGFVLAMQILETTGLYSRLVSDSVKLAKRARVLEEHVAARTQALHRANSEMAAIVEASPVALYMLDQSGAVAFWNASAERIFGYSEDDALGRLPPYLNEGDLGDFRANLALTIGHGEASGAGETQRRRKDGKIIDVQIRWARVNDDAGHVLGIMCAAADVTAHKRLEEQLLQTQKMEAIGNLTGGMAHDFNNLLGVIVGNLDLARDQLLPGDDELRELVDEALQAAWHGADLTRRLLAFARRQPLRPAQINVNELVTDTVRLLRRVLGENIEISLNLDNDTWPVVADPAQLEAALANLATNARDAMLGGGRLSIETRNAQLDHDYAAAHVDVTPGDYALILVSDTGSGMSPETMSRVFEPFFTTKEPGKGTGLGLSMVFGFLKQSNGHVNVYSELGVGTTFRLYLPRSRTVAAGAAATSRQSLVRGSGERVLVVEDNVSVRRVATRQLRDLGYRVFEAERAAAALDFLQHERFDLLFTDIVMPGGLDGIELARLALERWPQLKIVLTSGFPEVKTKTMQDFADGLALLSKPYSKDDLARTVRGALGA
jgi:PAS domain S-box-containing protein